MQFNKENDRLLIQ